ncbi:ABC transporter permease [Lactobacillus mulieris]|uniref:ABC transporter permease n=1 Tax=Lactobacillus mulieris TaxID=2508708 RepID=A0AAW5WXH7_9LACO|nr:ABC transporter permease [Lactobacillus mulieris]MCZ3621677.1 ABC transporter permease [Lactobacillus mulieris]MCZ3623047.1 ABC transporter permease [Lactobacillus mulieris]MCZ3635684.1 ABC transporter permease [Lactobacillus mulieris]MCZ3690083.1 ABC transporter permease [Lactobacillus mulieris]MCZ3696021.1 ABC transporter permease [Lactobacillus mulieris]
MNKFYLRILLLPVTLFVVLFAIVPILELIMLTIKGSNFYFFEYVSFFKNSYNVRVLIKTIEIAIFTVLIVLFIAFPLSLWITRQKTWLKGILTLFVLFPILTNTVVRNYAWIIILGKDGIINNFLSYIHVINQPLNILYTPIAIIIGSVYLFLPIMVITLMGSASELNIETEEAASILGATPSVSLIKIIIPQLLPGILTGSILVFAGAMTAYTTPQILGGNKNLVMSTLIYQQSMTLGNWQNASVVAIILIVISVLTMTILRKLSYKIDRRKLNA